MSFTAEVKDELSRIKNTDHRADLAELSALVRVCGALYLTGKGQSRLELSTETGVVARVLLNLLHNAAELKTEFTVRRSVLHKSRNYLISIPAQERLEELLYHLGIFHADRQLVLGIAPQLIETPEQVSAYLRGIFMGGGFIANPKGDFHFELVLRHEALAQDLVSLLSHYQVSSRMVKRRSEFTVYIKNVEEMLDFLALAGAHRSALEIENIRVLKALRNDVNRQVNAEMANQKKSSQASLEQLKLIDRIDKKIGLEKLPGALKTFCYLRRRYPELNLRELGEVAHPPLSKSAINHRLRRIHEIAQSLDE